MSVGRAQLSNMRICERVTAPNKHALQLTVPPTMRRSSEGRRQKLNVARTIPTCHTIRCDGPARCPPLGVCPPLIFTIRDRHLKRHLHYQTRRKCKRTPRPTPTRRDTLPVNAILLAYHYSVSSHLLFSFFYAGCRTCESFKC